MRLPALSILLVPSLLLMNAGAVPADSPGPKQAPSIAPTELEARRASDRAPLVIDVRSAGEYASGHIPGAVNVPYDEVAERIADLDTSNGVALYCMVGPRARKGEAALLAAGYHDVLHLEGGLSAWKAAGLPVDRGD